MVETLAELPFIGDQVLCLSHDQAARSLRSTQFWFYVAELARCRTD